MIDKSKTIVFFSLYYPFSFSDGYVNEEINMLAGKVERIIIVSGDTESADRRPTPANSAVYRFSSHTKSSSKYAWLHAFFSPFFYRELVLILFKYKTPLSAGLFTELLAFYGRGLRTRRFIQKLIEREKLDANQLLIYTYWMLEPTLAAALLKKDIPALKVISRAHSQDVYFFRSPHKYLPYRKFIFDRLQHLYFISANAQKYFAETHFLTPAEINKTSVSRIGIPGNGIFVKGKPDGKLKIVSVAFVQKLKRIDLIIDALALLADVQVEWYHMGHCPQGKEYFEEIKNYAAQKFSGKTNISFVFTGKTPKKELNEIYGDKTFDIFINTSETEGIPVSMMEAMSYSVPVMGTDVGGVSEIVEDEKNGFLLKPDIPAQEIAALLKQYYNLSEDKKEQFRRNAFNTWKEKFNSSENYAKFTDEISAL